VSARTEVEVAATGGATSVLDAIVFEILVDSEVDELVAAAAGALSIVKPTSVVGTGVNSVNTGADVVVTGGGRSVVEDWGDAFGVSMTAGNGVVDSPGISTEVGAVATRGRLFAGAEDGTSVETGSAVEAGAFNSQSLSSNRLLQTYRYCWLGIGLH
jgi:hypothetical protein